MRNNEVILLVDTYRKLHRRSAKVNLVNIIDKTHPADLALLFRSFTQHERLYFFSLTKDNEKKAEILSEVDDNISVEILQSLKREDIIQIFREMDYDDESNILRLLPQEEQQELLKLMKKEESQEIEALMGYDEDTAGGIMNPEVFHLFEDYTVAQATAEIQKSADTEMVFYIYVTDERTHLIGVVSLRQLILNDPHKKLSEIMVEDVISIRPETDQEEVARIASRYNFIAVPVVDDGNKLIGVVTVDDIIDVLREEATEDLLQMAGLGRDTDIILKSTWETIKRRFPWLLATYIGGLIAAMVIGAFHDLLGSFVILTSFIPVIAGMGGNIGTQSSTIITRGLLTGRVNPHTSGKIIFKELRVGAILGTIYGLVLGGIAFLMTFILHTNGYNYSLVNCIELSIAIAIGIVISMSLATFTGSIAPIILNKLKIDPAVATGPFVQTTIDILGILIYLLIATGLIHFL
ncbi:MAG: magnesium transporter [Candidatus Marinimicrobia bacterium]|nr:magnesium transporter [Candidatus Neomarinimicrobiota bacterium]